MTPTEINKAIAEACGWTCDSNGWWSHPTLPDNGGAMSEPPDFANSLDACAMFEQTLTDADREKWALNVDLWFTESQRNTYGWTRAYYLITATPRQRCEAFLRVKGLWK